MSKKYRIVEEEHGSFRVDQKTLFGWERVNAWGNHHMTLAAAREFIKSWEEHKAWKDIVVEEVES